MKLYFSPGACSLSPHVALREVGVPFDLVQVDLRAKKTKAGDDYLAINPKGYVPALRLDDGELVTEGAIIVQYIADLRPELRLAPPPGTPERRRLQEWLHFIATELQKGFAPINNPNAGDELKQALKARLLSRFAFLAQALEGKRFLLDTFSVADGYAYYVLRSLRKLDPAALQGDPTLAAYFDRLSSRPAVQAAVQAEGIAP
ncbi:MAG: glutathione transferase GstA [Polyangia bacterium]|jgi:glutathione S-transferase